MGFLFSRLINSVCQIDCSFRAFSIKQTELIFKLNNISNIIKQFNDTYGGLFSDPKRMEQRITKEIPEKVAADEKYQNAKKNSDRENAKIEHDKALRRVITALFKDDAQLFKQFQDNESFRGWLTDMVFVMTYEE